MLKPPEYKDGSCLDVVNNIFLLSDEKLYKHIFNELEPVRCCIPYYKEKSNIVYGLMAGTVEGILFYQKKYKAYYTSESLYNLILADLEERLKVQSLDEIAIKDPVMVEDPIDEGNCFEYGLCWDSLGKKESSINPKGKVEFQEGASSKVKL